MVSFRLRPAFWTAAHSPLSVQNEARSRESTPFVVYRISFLPVSAGRSLSNDKHIAVWAVSTVYLGRLREFPCHSVMNGRPSLGPLPVLPWRAWLPFQLASDLEGSGQEDGPAVEGPVLFPEPRGKRAPWLFFFSGREAALRWRECGLPGWPRPVPGPRFGLPTSW